RVAGTGGVPDRLARGTRVLPGRRRQAGGADRARRRRLDGRGALVHPARTRRAGADRGHRRGTRAATLLIMRQRRRIAAFGVVRDRSGRILLTRGGGAWELPGHQVRQGEHPSAAVVRGFVERTGLTARVGTVREVVTDL